MEGLRQHVIQLEEAGLVSVYIQGEAEKLKEGVVFLTVHDVGASYETWVNFVNHDSMAAIRRRCVFLHLSVPGQAPGSPDLPTFPSMHQLGLALVTVLDHLRVPMVVGLGEGAGANIITRFGMLHPGRVHGLVTINNSASTSLGRFMGRLRERMGTSRKEEEQILNEKNVARFAESYQRRNEILTELNNKIKCEVLLVAGARCRQVGDTEAIHRQLHPRLSSIIKVLHKTMSPWCQVEDVEDPLAESQVKVAEAILLFCQGLGLLPSVAHREAGGRHGSFSMLEADKPNIRRLSLAVARA